jgi:hypothetical protein
MNLHFDVATGTDFYRDASGAEFRCGLLPSPVPADAPLASAALGFAVIPRSEIKPVDLWVHDPQIWNQNPHSSCSGHGAVATFSGAYHLGGAPPKRFSPTYVYGNIIADKNRGDNGARLDETLKEVTQRGVCTEDLVGRGAIYRRQWANRAAADQEAELFKGAEWLNVRTFDEILTLHQLGFFVSFGISLGRNFNPGSDGVVPRRSGGGGGHAMAAGGVRIVGGRHLLIVKNSWGPSFGNGGFCYMDESYFTEGDMAAYGGVWAIRVATNDPKTEPKIG